MNAEKELITIDEVAEGKFGWYAKVGGVFYNSGKFFKGLKDMKAGTLYEVEVYTSDKGNKYIQKLLGPGSIKDNPHVENKTIATGSVPPVKAPPKSRDFDAEARGKTRCAIMEAALQSPALVQLASSGNIDDLKVVLKKLADFGYAYVFGDDK